MVATHATKKVTAVTTPETGEPRSRPATRAGLLARLASAHASRDPGSRPDRRELHPLAGPRRVPHLVAAGIDADVVDATVGGEEDEVTRADARLRDAHRGESLGARRAREPLAQLFGVDVVDEAGAVERARPRGAPAVGIPPLRRCDARGPDAERRGDQGGRERGGRDGRGRCRRWSPPVAADGDSALPVAASRPAASSGVTIRERMRAERDMVDVDMGIPSHACEVSCRVRTEAARPLSRLHPEDRCRPGCGSPTPALSVSELQRRRAGFGARRAARGGPRAKNYPSTVATPLSKSDHLRLRGVSMWTRAETAAAPRGAPGPTAG